MAALKLVSLNVERSKHLDRVVPFLQRENADVVCMQEFVEHDIDQLSQALQGASCVYEPLAKRPQDHPPGIIGLGIFSRLPMSARRADYYVGKPGVLLDNIQIDETTYNNMNRVVLSCDIEKEGNAFQIATTHFRWTPNGEPDQGQREDMMALLRVLTDLGQFVLCGDFNAPRGGEIFSMLASRFKDNIPVEYKTSIDGSLHRSGPLPYMVDGLFTTPGYVARDVRLQFGVSDHAAIIATISKV
jgi:endonuclease/exonuclease/phosphatase family metal-dependent hydrolase